MWWDRDGRRRTTSTLGTQLRQEEEGEGREEVTSIGVRLLRPMSVQNRIQLNTIDLRQFLMSVELARRRKCFGGRVGRRDSITSTGIALRSTAAAGGIGISIACLLDRE